MAYSLRIRLWFGLLKIKSQRVLTPRERDGWVPVWRLGSIYFVWRSYQPRLPEMIGFRSPRRRRSSRSVNTSIGARLR